MPRTKTITLYQYDELSERAKERAQQWWLEGFDYDWWDYTIEDIKTCAALLGFTIRGPSWDLERGSYFHFGGTWHLDECKLAELKEHAPEDKLLHAIADDLAELVNDVTLADSKVLGDHMFAGISMSDHGQLSLNCDFMDADEEEAVRSATVQLCQWALKQLRAEWEYQTSKEQVAEMIRINEYEFTEDGKRA